MRIVLINNEVGTYFAACWSVITAYSCRQPYLQYPPMQCAFHTHLEQNGESNSRNMKKGAPYLNMKSIKSIAGRWSPVPGQVYIPTEAQSKLFDNEYEILKK